MHVVSSSGSMNVEPTPKMPHPQAHARTTLGVTTMVKHKRKVCIFDMSNTPVFVYPANCYYVPIGSRQFQRATISFSNQSEADQGGVLNAGRKSQHATHSFTPSLSEGTAIAWVVSPLSKVAV